MPASDARGLRRSDPGAGLLPLVAVLGILILAACGPEPGAAEQGREETDDTAWTMPDVPAPIARGIRVYRANHCGTCHRSTLAGTTGIFGPSHDSLAAEAAARIRDPGYRGHATTPAAYVRESIVEPGAWRVPGYERTHFPMPAYTELTDAELDALVRMILWLPQPEGDR